MGAAKRARAPVDGPVTGPTPGFPTVFAIHWD
jgi:hypothetical protein